VTSSESQAGQALPRIYSPCRATISGRCCNTGAGPSLHLERVEATNALCLCWGELGCTPRDLDTYLVCQMHDFVETDRQLASQPHNGDGRHGSFDHDGLTFDTYARARADEQGGCPSAGLWRGRLRPWPIVDVAHPLSLPTGAAWPGLVVPVSDITDSREADVVTHGEQKVPATDVLSNPGL